jgi:hypothetical protein
LEGCCSTIELHPQGLKSEIRSTKSETKSKCTKRLLARFLIRI